jgi:hypothetical protein
VTTNRRSAQLLAATCTALREAIARHMPAGAYRDFTVWAFSPKNPRQQEFLAATGVLQLIKMNTTLLSGLIDDSHWIEVVRHVGMINAYQVLEVISGNLAIGLGNTELDERDLQRRGLVSALNRAMIETLTPGRRSPAVLLLAGPARDVARHTSGSDQSLAAAKHAGIAEEYALSLAAQGAPVPAPEELESGLWPALVANVETCRELVEAMDGTTTSGLLRQGLIDHYSAVDRILHAQHLSRLELAWLGAQTILVLPTLAFILGALAEKINPLKGYPRTVADGVIADVLTDAALLVRLQDDIGTTLLRMPPVRQAAALHEVTRRHAGEDGGEEDGEGGLRLLMHHGRDPVFTRLHRALVNGESNLALWHARRARDPGAAWPALADSLAYYAGLYAQHSQRLAVGLAALDERLGDRRVSSLIERLVRFHERMYAYRHTDLSGEYAV